VDCMNLKRRRRKKKKKARNIYAKIKLLLYLLSFCKISLHLATTSSVQPQGQCGGGESGHLPVEAAGEEESTQPGHGAGLDQGHSHCHHLQARQQSP